MKKNGRFQAVILTLVMKERNGLALMLYKQASELQIVRLDENFVELVRCIWVAGSLHRCGRVVDLDHSF